MEHASGAQGGCLHRQGANVPEDAPLTTAPVVMSDGLKREASFLGLLFSPILETRCAGRRDTEGVQ